MILFWISFFGILYLSLFKHKIYLSDFWVNKYTAACLKFKWEPDPLPMPKKLTEAQRQHWGEGRVQSVISGIRTISRADNKQNAQKREKPTEKNKNYIYIKEASVWSTIQ